MIVRRALQKNPESFIAIIGCYAQLKPDEISKIEGVDLVLGATEKLIYPIISAISRNVKLQKYIPVLSTMRLFLIQHFLSRQEKNISENSGRLRLSCTYCTIPLARGASRSATIDEILKQVENIAANGTKEIVLTGVNIAIMESTMSDPANMKVIFRTHQTTR